MSQKTVIGLSFGNSTSAIAFEKDGKVELIANQDGDRMIPSAISYSGSDEYHGAQAKAQLIRNSKNTVAYFRDFIGQPFDKIDPTHSSFSAHPQNKEGSVSYTLKTESDIFDDDGNVVEAKEARAVSGDEILARHFHRLRDSAEDFIGKSVEGCVMAVPTDFTDAQKEHLKKVAEETGLKVMQIINEPSAALLAHVAESRSTSDKLFVVADFGGTRTDGAVIASRGGIFTILTTLHDTDLGGKLLDQALCEFVAKEFEKQHSIDVRSDARAMAKLLAEAEQVKKTLSNATSTNFAVESLSQGIDFRISINRLRFELISRSVLTRLQSFVTELVKKANLDVLDIDEVLMVGGSSYIPKLASNIVAEFHSNTHCEVIAAPLDGSVTLPDELISRGCAIQASLVSGFDAEEIAESTQPVVTVAPHLTKPIGVKVHHEHHGFVVVVPEVTALPIRKTHKFNTASNTSVLVSVCEGEKEIVVHKVEKEDKPKNQDDEEESDWSDDEDEDQETRHRVFKAGKELAQLALKDVQPNTEVEVVINITKDHKVQVAARELRPHGVAVRGDC